MIVGVFLLLCAGALPRDQSSLGEVIEAARRGEIARSWVELERLSDPLSRAQARVFVLARAGDLEGALRSGLESLREHPRDAWLCERVTALAASLRRGALAATELAQLRAALHALDATEAQRATLREREREVDELLELEARAQAAGMRSRVTLAILLVLILVGAARLFTGTKRNRPVEAWARQGG